MTTKMKYLTLLIEPDLLEDVDSLVEELRKKGVKPKRNSGSPIISRSIYPSFTPVEFGDGTKWGG